MSPKQNCETFVLSQGLHTCPTEQLPPLPGGAQWPLTEAPGSPSGPRHTLCSQNLLLQFESEPVTPLFENFCSRGLQATESSPCSLP